MKGGPRMEFEVATVYEKEDLEGLSAAYSYTKRPLRTLGKLQRWLSLFSGVLLVAVSLLGLAGCIHLFPGLLSRGERNFFPFLLMTLAWMLLLFLLGVRLLAKGNAPLFTKLSWRLYKQKGEPLCFRFDPAHFRQERPNVKSELEYGCIRRLLEDADRFYLFDSPGSAFILPKRDFKRGTPEEFRDFISRVTGKPVEQIT